MESFNLWSDHAEHMQILHNDELLEDLFDLEGLLEGVAFVSSDVGSTCLYMRREFACSGLLLHAAVTVRRGCEESRFVMVMF